MGDSVTRDRFRQAGTAVVKVGSSLLASLEGGLDRAFVSRLSADLASLRQRPMRIVLVSSGAVAAGTPELGLSARPATLPEVQAAAAVGQAALMQTYREAFATASVPIGQVLLTRDGLQDRRRFLYARQTLLALLDHGVLPIVNENDTVAVEELRLKMGDNDQLAAVVAQLIDADGLVILTDVPGFYDRPPNVAGAELIPQVEALTPELLQSAGGSGSAVGTGGMTSKLSAALAASISSVPMVVADGHAPGILQQVFGGEEVGTYFQPRSKRTPARQQWIAFGRETEGAVVIDDGAVRALVEGKKSLLAIGIRSVEGQFREADTVRILSLAGEEVARGLCNFSAHELRQIAGTHSCEHGQRLGYDSCDTVVHRDNMVMLAESVPGEVGSADEE